MTVPWVAMLASWLDLNLVERFARLLPVLEGLFGIVLFGKPILVDHEEALCLLPTAPKHAFLPMEGQISTTGVNVGGLGA
eukprot:CAMPEP_0197877850 /NCGR_PEP_ID=MMETSP1439-20131203/6418_1 /TAXON_ID=66791 /ORGANISM="Gonyaulax spinifera, Strain CCMP409" /LENGTH=79 /DNA_ID=CAMNT_0043497227 /DNA_START=78 /DNA_END=314 /DNA_ORIENTATION=-